MKFSILDLVSPSKGAKNGQVLYRQARTHKFLTPQHEKGSYHLSRDVSQNFKPKTLL